MKHTFFPFPVCCQYINGKKMDLQVFLHFTTWFENGWKNNTILWWNKENIPKGYIAIVPYIFGNRKIKLVPISSILSTWMVPLWRFTIQRTIERPRAVPPFSRGKTFLISKIAPSSTKILHYSWLVATFIQPTHLS